MYTTTKPQKYSIRNKFKARVVDSRTQNVWLSTDMDVVRHAHSFQAAFFVCGRCVMRERHMVEEASREFIIYLFIPYGQPVIFKTRDNFLGTCDGTGGLKVSKTGVDWKNPDLFVRLVNIFWHFERTVILRILTLMERLIESRKIYKIFRII